ncbi:MAG TPA: hypothetical protein VFS67_22890 [Polyangiaceae bacterium]|jgi:hypothetical protein|nr:hypothetical protein [Polyangiaceae bacterium]
MPKRDFPTLLTAFLATAAVGASVGTAKNAKAEIIIVCDEDGFCEAGGTPDPPPPAPVPFDEGPFDEAFFQVVQPLPPDLPPIFLPLDRLGGAIRGLGL